MNSIAASQPLNRSVARTRWTHTPGPPCLYAVTSIIGCPYGYYATSRLLVTPGGTATVDATVNDCNLATRNHSPMPMAKP